MTEFNRRRTDPGFTPTQTKADDARRGPYTISRDDELAVLQAKGSSFTQRKPGDRARKVNAQLAARKYNRGY